jgi:hypothetical protein
LPDKRSQNKSLGDLNPSKKGELVWLDRRNLKTLYTSKKIASKHEEPFVISDVLGPLTY